MNIHTAGTGTQLTAKTACTELQLSKKTIVDGSFVALNFGKLGGERRIGYGSAPCFIKGEGSLTG